MHQGAAAVDDVGDVALSLVFVIVVAYTTTIAAYRTDVDPDTYGIPIVSSSVDLVGAFTIIIAISLLGLA